MAAVVTSLEPACVPGAALSPWSDPAAQHCAHQALMRAGTRSCGSSVLAGEGQGVGAAVAVGAGAGAAAGSWRHRPAGHRRAGLLFRDRGRQQCDPRPQELSSATARGIRVTGVCLQTPLPGAHSASWAWDSRRLRCVPLSPGLLPAKLEGPQHTAGPPDPGDVQRGSADRGGGLLARLSGAWGEGRQGHTRNICRQNPGRCGWVGGTRKGPVQGRAPDLGAVATLHVHQVANAPGLQRKLGSWSRPLEWAWTAALPRWAEVEPLFRR